MNTYVLVSRRWSHAAHSVQTRQAFVPANYSGTESDQGFRNRVSRRKSHFDKADIRHLNDLKETSPLDMTPKIPPNPSRDSLPEEDEEDEESDVFSGMIHTI